jgi:hypothetical protein
MVGRLHPPTVVVLGVAKPVESILWGNTIPIADHRQT